MTPARSSAALAVACGLAGLSALAGAAPFTVAAPPSAITTPPSATQAPVSTLPPSIRGAAPSTAAPSDEELAVECKELKSIIDTLSKDAQWNAQPHSDRELGSLRRMLARLACPGESNGPHAGTWRIEGIPNDHGPQLLAGTLTLEVVDAATGTQLAAENYGFFSVANCTSAFGNAYFYKGTITWDRGSYFEREAGWHRTDDGGFGIGTVLVCGSSSLMGRYRDSYKHFGGLLELDSQGGGVTPQAGHRLKFKLTRQAGALR